MARGARQSGFVRGLQFAVAAAAALATQLGLERAQRDGGGGAPYTPRPEAARILALGQRALLSDYYWLKAVQLVGGAAHPAQHAATLARLTDLATRLDPWIDHPYRFAALWLDGLPGWEHRVNHILRRGIAYHPREWRNRLYLSFNLFFHLGEDAAAADALEPAVTLPGAPGYLQLLLARLRSQDGEAGLEVAAAYLHELAAEYPEGVIPEPLEDAIAEVETERRARRLDRAREVYVERRGRDIETPVDLLHGPDPILAALPPLPDGASWILAEPGGEIVSSRYGRRYRPHFADGRRTRRGDPAQRGEIR